jgi:hypothetical protein
MALIAGAGRPSVAVQLVHDPFSNRARPPSVPTQTVSPAT